MTIVPQDENGLLLKYGYEQELDADVQGIYSELIPDCEDAAREKKTSLKQIDSRNTETRLATATYLCKHARWEWSFYREFWLKHPETVESLIDYCARRTLRTLLPGSQDISRSVRFL